MRHEIHVGTKDQERYQLDTFALGADRVYVDVWQSRNPTIYDTSGHKLENLGDAWQAEDCHWSRKRKAIAEAGDVAQLHELLYLDAMKHRRDDPDGPTCAAAQPVDAARGQRLDALLASRETVRAQSPQFVRDLVLGKADAAEQSDEARRAHEDLVRVIQEHMSWYVEWPHVDGLFLEVFHTLPGHVVRHWYDTMDGGKPAVD